MKALVKRMAGLSVAGTNCTTDNSPFTAKVTEASKSSTLELQATGSDPVATRAYLDFLMQEFFAFKKETREKASERTLGSVTAEVRELEQELKAQQEKLHDFQSSNNVVFLQEQGNGAGSYLAQLNRRIASLRTQLQLLARLDPEQWIAADSRGDALGAGEPPQASANDVLANLAGPQAELFKAHQQVQLLKAKRDELSRFLRPLHPKILKLNEELVTQERLVQISREEALRQLANRRQALQLEIGSLESAFNEWDLKAIDSSRRIADYDRMRQDLQRLQAAYERLLGVIQTVDVSKTLDQENVGVLEPASAARPIPRMAINLLVGMFAASVLSFAAFYGLSLFDDRFASPAELPGYLSEQVLGQIPSIPLKRPARQLSLEFLERQRFEFLEAFRNLRSALLFMPNGEARPKTILVSSSLPREGKSTVALYLAATMAIGRSRVLLVDADMRRPALNKLLAAAPGPGLAEILNGGGSPADAIASSNLDNLFLLPAGVARQNPGELVLSPEWPRLLAELYTQFDYILIDSPPLLATDDGASLAPNVDGVLMVVRGSFTSARMARRGLELLRQRRAHVLGLIFNRAVSSSNGYHYYQHFRDEYRWHPQPSTRTGVLVGGARLSTSERAAS
jgi:capsular exopolysaccharide synthesis family protein